MEHKAGPRPREHHSQIDRISRYTVNPCLPELVLLLDGHVDAVVFAESEQRDQHDRIAPERGS